MQFQRRVSEQLLKRSRVASTSIIPPQLPTQRNSKLSTSLLRCQRRCVSSRPNPIHQQKLAKQRSANDNPAALAEAKKEANKKVMLLGANSVLFFGMAMWLLVFVDRYFQNREREIIQKTLEQLTSDFEDMDEWDTKYQDHPALCACLVRFKSRELREIFPVEVGEVVDVLVEGVGRDGTLNICRSRPQNPNQKAVVSLYPMGCLQRINLENGKNSV